MPGPRSIASVLASSILLIILLCALQTLPGCGDSLSSARKTARQMQNSTHVRGIHSGCVLFAQGNRDYYPGLDSNGDMSKTPLPAGKDMHGTTSVNGYEPVYRFAKLLQGNYFSPEYLVSPVEGPASKSLAPAGTNITAANFSYALLRIDGDKSTRRAQEWRATNNSMAPVISDRNLGAGGSGASIHDGGKWIGSVAYNDNHANFATGSLLSTQFGPNRVNADDLFADNNDSAGAAGNDAAMVYQDATTYVNQK